MPTKREDLNHNAVVTDDELERGEHPVGQLVHISTVTHAWRGQLAATTASYYVLDNANPVALIDGTGDMSSYLESPTQVRDGDEYKPSKKGMIPTVRIPRSAVAWMVSWQQR